MSQFFNLVKRIAALRHRLSQLQGKLKFAIRRGSRAIALNAIFEIDRLEAKIEALTAIQSQNLQTPRKVAKVAAKAQKRAVQETFTVHNGQLVKTSQLPANIHQLRCSNLTVHNGRLIPTLDAYYESLQLPDIERGYCTGEEYWKAVDKRREFIMQSIYDKLENDPTHPLLIFTPVILQLVHKFRQAWYWVDFDRKDYHIRAAISEEATVTYYDKYPVERYSSKDTGLGMETTPTYWHHPFQCKQGISKNNERFFFCRNQSTRQWELWHYLNREQMAKETFTVHNGQSISISL